MTRAQKLPVLKSRMAFSDPTAVIIV
jgi:hypothetical protein